MKKFTKFLVSGLLIVGGLYGISQHATNDVQEVEAAKVSKWGISGSFNGWGEDPMTYNAETKRYEYLLIGATTSTEFKIRPDGGWLGWNNNSGNTSNGKGTYLTGTDNYKFKVAGDFIIFVYDNSSASYEPWAGDVGVAKYVPAQEFTVTYHADKVVTETYTDKQTWNSKFIEKEGYRLEGWYTDANLTKKFAKGTAVTSNFDLYPNYVEAEDYTIWFDDDGKIGTACNVYMWRDATEGTNAKWPGTAISKNADGLWEVKIDASQSYDHVIFNGGNNKPQTANLELYFVSGTYTINGQDAETKFTASFEEYVEPAPAHDFKVNVKAAEEDPRTLQFSASIDATVAAEVNKYAEDTEYAGNYKVGFKFDFAYGEKVDTRYYTCTATLEALDGVLAEEAGVVAFFAVVVTEIPAEYTAVTVTPAYQNLEGKTVYGQAYTYSFVA